MAGHIFPAEANDDTVQTNPSPASLVFPAGSHLVQTGRTTPQELLAYAKTLTGISYKYGSANPATGLDCSGFIMHVFNHFGIAVPRCSVDFTNIDGAISLSQSKPGDIILFTGTENISSNRTVGHIGIITSNENGEQYFIQSTSGKAHGVTTSLLSPSYAARFVKVLRVFPQNN